MVKTCVIRLWVKEGPNLPDQIASCAFQSFLVEEKQMMATYMQRMRNKKLEIRFAARK